ncbi:AMP-binding protein [Prosthecobacter sp.]|uniref:AMP-binding protein n=1 Tax=Prosthecobacter sp. TaxID=1965333 RepID=UPI002ABC757B|nr:AMP-binding protein [Prosthecobacter sp.]MDZ4405057.1 AMP-binding protein [Prosthecobacter sp.]
METSLILKPEFWSDGGVWVAQPEDCEEGSTLADFASHQLQAKDWCFFQTSGSEGIRKWVGLTKESMLISARAVSAHFDITERDHWLLALPIHHVGGFGVLARSFVSGSRVTKLEGKWDAAEFARRCKEVEATLASLVPTQVFDLVAAKLSAPESIRVVMVGGGAMSRDVELAALKLGWPVRRTYGMTETASQVASQTTEDGEMEVLPIWELSTDDAGVLTVRGEALAKGYAVLEAEQWCWEPISAETGLRTRDRVHLWQDDARQFLRFVDRETNTVKILGELVALGPIQERVEVLRLEMGLHADDAAVCDVPDARKEARLVLVVSGMSGSDAGRLQKGLNETLRPFERVEDVRRVDLIPRSDLGKPLLEELRRQL